MAENTKNKAKSAQASDDPRVAEAAKTNRLRSLRLAKEAADQEAAAREAAAAPPRKTAKARSTSHG